jgi:hypothetical protein
LGFTHRDDDNLFGVAVDNYFRAGKKQNGRTIAQLPAILIFLISLFLFSVVIHHSSQQIECEAG